MAIRQKATAVKVGLFSTFSLLLMWLMLNTLENQTSGASLHYSAMFTDVNGLRVGDDIRIAGVRAGRVDSIKVVSGQAKVAFEVGDSSPILNSSTLVMRYQNLLGMRYVEVDPGATTGTPLPDGALIPVAKTSPGFNLTALLNGFRPLFNVLQPAAVNELSASVVQVLQGQGGSVASLLQQVTQLTNFVADRDHLLTSVADTLTPVLGNLASQGTALQGTVTHLASLVSGLADNRATIGTSIDSLQGLLGEVTPLVQETREPLRADIAKLQELFAMYLQNRSGFEKALPALGELIATQARTYSYTSGQNLYNCDLGFLIGGQTITLGGAHPKFSEVCR